MRSLLLTVLATLLLAVPALADPPTPQQQLSLYMVQKKLDKVQEILTMNPGLVNLPFQTGGTPLMAAIGLQSDADMLNTLLNNGANPNLAAPSGSTPLVLAVSTGQAATVTLLLSRRANPNVQDAKGRTPLHMAVGLAQVKDVNTSVAVVQALLNGRANPNVADQDGRMPLHLAIFLASTKGDAVAAQVVSVLVGGGADPKAVLTFGGDGQTKKVTPLELAQQLNATKTMETLARAGG